MTPPEDRPGLTHRGNPDVIRQIAEITEIARRSLIPEQRQYRVVEDGVRCTMNVTRQGVGPISVAGIDDFFLFDFHVDDQWEKYTVVVHAELDDQLKPRFMKASSPSLPLRLDSGCETGQLFGDKTCECGPQLQEALRRFSERGNGILINIPRQDGRGMGLPFKLATLTLQAQLGYDTVHAARTLEPTQEIDRRTYGGAVGILRFLGVTSEVPLALISNNPAKANALRENGYIVAEDHINVGLTDENRHHLQAKSRWFNHSSLHFDPSRPREEDESA